MRWLPIVALLALIAEPSAAQTASWRVDVMGAALVEAWDLNGTRESMGGGGLGVERRAWRGIAVRAEGLVLRVAQAGDGAWLPSGTVGVRLRWGGPGRFFADLAAGGARASHAVPPGGTRFNYVALAGAGGSIPLRGRLSLDAGARWVHVSNNGREGRHRNPDLQTLGGLVALGWRD